MNVYLRNNSRREIEMKKVLITTALAGFIRSFLKNDIEILKNMGYEVHCAANKNHAGASDIDRFFEENNIIFHQIDFSSNKPISKDTIKAYKQLKDLKCKYDFKVVHCHTPISGALTRYVFKDTRKKGTKVIYTTHGFYFHKGSSKKTWIVFRSIEDLMSRLSDMIITINKEDFENANKMHCNKVRYINGVGVDTNKFTNCKIEREKYRKLIGIKEDDLMILAIGELSNRKNHQIIIKALGKLQIRNSVFVICGNAITEEATTNELKRLANKNNVKLHLLGLRKDIPEIIKCADIGVISSTREGLGLAGIEMLAGGLPLVASNVHGIIDYMYDSKTGYVCNPYSENEFAEAILKLVDKQIREEMSDKCVNSAKRFDKTISYKQMNEIYKEISQL